MSYEGSCLCFANLREASSLAGGIGTLLALKRGLPRDHDGSGTEQGIEIEQG